MISIGVIGETRENGHPFSFSAILNGFSASGIRAAGWGLIADYLEVAPPDLIGNLGAKATHVWFPDLHRAELLSAATNIDYVASSITEVIEEADAVMILRDDWERNFGIALQSLESGKPTFVDKPLSLRRPELDTLLPFIAEGQLMSASGFRFAPELADSIGTGFGSRRKPPSLFLAASGPSSWGHSALHLLEPGLVISEAVGVPLLGETFDLPRRIKKSKDWRDDRLFVHLEPESALCFRQEEALLFSSPSWTFVLNLSESRLSSPFRLDFFTDDGRNARFELANRVGAFRGLLAAFISMVSSGEPPVSPLETLWAVERTIEGQELLERSAY